MMSVAAASFSGRSVVFPGSDSIGEAETSLAVRPRSCREARESKKSWDGAVAVGAKTESRRLCEGRPQKPVDDPLGEEAMVQYAITVYHCITVAAKTSEDSFSAGPRAGCRGSRRGAVGGKRPRGLRILVCLRGGSDTGCPAPSSQRGCRGPGTGLRLSTACTYPLQMLALLMCPLQGNIDEELPRFEARGLCPQLQ